jgi:hypothetical protein
VNRRFIGIVAIAIAATMLSADLASSRNRLTSHWRLSLQGSQTFTWEVSSSFDTAGGGNCTIRHAGDQTIKFETPGAVRVKVAKGDSPTVTSDALAYAYVRGRWRGIVPLRGTETRAHRVLELLPNRNECVNDPVARKSAHDCGATTPLVDTGTFVYFRAITRTFRRKPEVEWHVPVTRGFLRNVPSCDVRVFHLRDLFLYPLFTYGRFVALRGGSFLNARTRRLTATHSASFCMGTRYPAINREVPCTRPHAAKVTIKWRMTLTR